MAGQLAAMTAGSTLLSNAAASSRSLASLQALATASMIDKQAVTASERLKLEPPSLESILPTLNGPAAVAISSVSVFTTYCGDVVYVSSSLGFAFAFYYKFVTGLLFLSFSYILHH